MEDHSCCRNFATLSTEPHLSSSSSIVAAPAPGCLLPPVPAHPIRTIHPSPSKHRSPPCVCALALTCPLAATTEDPEDIQSTSFSIASATGERGLRTCHLTSKNKK